MPVSKENVRFLVASDQEPGHPLKLGVASGGRMSMRRAKTEEQSMQPLVLCCGFTLGYRGLGEQRQRLRVTEALNRSVNSG